MGIDDTVRDLADKVGLGDQADAAIDAADTNDDGDVSLDEAKGLLEKGKDMLGGN